MATWFQFLFGTSKPPRPRLTEQHLRDLRRDITILMHRKEQLMATGSNQKEIKDLTATINSYNELLGVAVASITRESVAKTLDRSKRVIQTLSNPDSATNAMSIKKVRDKISALGDVFSDDLSSDEEENEDTTASGGTACALKDLEIPTHEPRQSEPLSSRMPTTAAATVQAILGM